VVSAALLGLFLHQYRGEVTVARDRSGYPISTTIRVRGADGRPLWTRTFKESPGIAWSKDRRAVAIFDRSYHLTVWRAGDRVRRFNVNPYPPGENWGEPPSYEDSLRWSADKERLFLICPAAHGAIALGVGDLVVIRIDTGKAQRLDQVLRAEWISNRSVNYWVKRFREGKQPKIIGPIRRKVR